MYRDVAGPKPLKAASAFIHQIAGRSSSRKLKKLCGGAKGKVAAITPEAASFSHSILLQLLFPYREG
jgi:hypothetical protein